MQKGRSKERIVESLIQILVTHKLIGDATWGVLNIGNVWSPRTLHLGVFTALLRPLAGGEGFTSPSGLARGPPKLLVPTQIPSERSQRG